MKRVLIATASPIQLTESFIRIQAAAIMAQGWHVVIAAGGESQAPHVVDGIRYVSSPLPAPPRPRTPIARIKRVVATLWQRNREPTPVRFRKAWQDMIDHAEPDLILVQFGPTAARLLPLLRATGIPWIVQFHGYDATQLLGHWGYRLTVREIARRATAIFCCSNFLANEVANVASPADRGRIHVISPGYDGAIFNLPETDTARDESVGRDSPTRLISVARLTEGKGHHLVLQALARTTVPVRLDIIGEGDAREDLEKLVDDLGLGERVAFLGHRPHAEILSRMRTADIFIQASTTAANGWREGLGLSSVEAAATGLPVIVTDSGGLSETCCPESGIVVADGDIDGLASVIDLLATGPDQRMAMGTCGRAFVSRRYTSTVQAKMAVAFFNSYLSKGA